MNDYLWDKTGSDPEVEELERKMSLLRADVRVPHPNKIAKAERKAPFWRKFHFTAAIPAFAALLIGFVWYLQIDRVE